MSAPARCGVSVFSATCIGRLKCRLPRIGSSRHAGDAYGRPAMGQSPADQRQSRIPPPLRRSPGITRASAARPFFRITVPRNEGSLVSHHATARPGSKRPRPLQAMLCDALEGNADATAGVAFGRRTLRARGRRRTWTERGTADVWYEMTCPCSTLFGAERTRW